MEMGVSGKSSSHGGGGDAIGGYSCKLTTKAPGGFIGDSDSGNEGIEWLQ
jgi:hypothetical protein